MKHREPEKRPAWILKCRRSTSAMASSNRFRRVVPFITSPQTGNSELPKGYHAGVVQLARTGLVLCGKCVVCLRSSDFCLGLAEFRRRYQCQGLLSVTIRPATGENTREVRVSSQTRRPGTVTTRPASGSTATLAIAESCLLSRGNTIRSPSTCACAGAGGSAMLLQPPIAMASKRNASNVFIVRPPILRRRRAMPPGPLHSRHARPRSRAGSR